MPRYTIAGKARGIPYRIHWSVLLLLPIAWAFASSVKATLVVAASLFALVLVHELGRAALARFCGLGVIGFEFNLLHGRCLYEASEYEIETALVAWGGVLGQSLLLLFVAPLYVAGDVLPLSVVQLLAPMVAVLTVVNILYILVSLLPIAPLDGATAWKVVPYIRGGDLRRFLRARALARRVARG